MSLSVFYYSSSSFEIYFSFAILSFSILSSSSISLAILSFSFSSFSFAILSFSFQFSPSRSSPLLFSPSRSFPSSLICVLSIPLRQSQLQVHLFCMNLLIFQPFRMERSFQRERSLSSLMIYVKAGANMMGVLVHQMMMIIITITTMYYYDLQLGHHYHYGHHFDLPLVPL